MIEYKSYGTLIEPNNNNLPSDIMYPTIGNSEKKYFGSTNNYQYDPERGISSHKYQGRLFTLSGPDALFILYFALYVLYLFTGALVFSILETPGEQALIVQVTGAREMFLQKYPNVNDEDLEKLITEVVKASNRGVSAARNVSGEPNWSFGQSLFFSSTVVTTIGYGHVTPLSRSGKAFCILYAIFGIPLTLVLLSALVERLLSPTIWLLQWLNSRLGHLYQPLNIRLLHLLIIVCVLVSLFLLIPAGIFAYIEPEWDYLDSFYYCFISLTTIGLGDYIPGDSPDQPYRPIYKIAITGYLFVGITCMMLTLAVFYDIPQLNLGLLFTPSEGNDDGEYDDNPAAAIVSSSEKVRLATSGLGLQYGLDSGSTVCMQQQARKQQQKELKEQQKELKLKQKELKEQQRVKVDRLAGLEGAIVPSVLAGGENTHRHVVRVRSRHRDEDDDEEE